LPGRECGAQAYPLDFGFSNRIQRMVDAGCLIDENCLYHPFSFKTSLLDQSHLSETDSTSPVYPRYFLRNEQFSKNSRLLDDSRVDFRASGGYGSELNSFIGDSRFKDSFSLMPFVWAGMRYKKHFYSDVAFRSGRQRTGFLFGDNRVTTRKLVDDVNIERLTLGYRSDQALIEFGRGREVTGVMAEENLLLSNSSAAFDRLLLQLNYKHLSYRYFYGYLESFTDTVFIGSSLDTTLINRYIVGRTLEYNNHSGFIVGVSELSILSGPNRPIDMAFLNPIASHVEIEQNDHDNTRAGSGENGLWALHLDWRPMKNWRLAGSILLDDYQLDSGDRDQKQDQLGFQAHTSVTMHPRSGLLILFGDFAHVGTFTTMHRNGINNMVSKGIYLGHPVGNDAEFWQGGLTYLPNWDASYEIAIGEVRRGEKSMLANPYLGRGAPQKAPFPSGKVSSWQFIDLKINQQLYKQYELDFRYMLSVSSTGPIHRDSQGELTLRYQVIWNTSL